MTLYDNTGFRLMLFKRILHYFVDKVVFMVAMLANFYFVALKYGNTHCGNE